jgi:uncharacterized UPF0146 family protein
MNLFLFADGSKHECNMVRRLLADPQASLYEKADAAWSDRLDRSLALAIYA